MKMGIIRTPQNPPVPPGCIFIDTSLIPRILLIDTSDSEDPKRYQ